MGEIQKMSGESKDILAENIQKIKELFPEVITEDKIDFEQLKEVLGEYVEDKQERYKFEWHGKSQALRLSQTPSMGTLRPCKEESKNWDTTENLYIEGDNLEVLKLLQKTYHNRVKMIYIDPPYNTGNDFVYEDDFKDNTKNYLEITGQTDEEGNRISTNSEAGGRYHTNWLNMMYPRLRLARNLLSEDGVIFISIDDNEVHNLKKICNEIFGEVNFEGHIHWRRRHNQPNDRTKMIGLVAEHVISYAKNSKALKKSGVGKIALTGNFSNPDNDPRGSWASKPWKVASDQSGSVYEIITPTGVKYTEKWMGEESTFNELRNENRIIFTRNGNGLPRKKYYKSERMAEGQCATNWWNHDVFGHNQSGNDLLSNLFNMRNVFSNPKPVELINGLIQITNFKKGDIALDFFSGSASTAHSLFENILLDGITKNFIMVQLPENLDIEYRNSTGEKKRKIKISLDFLDSINKPHFLTEIGKERIRRAGDKIVSELKENQNGQQNLTENENQINPDDLDIGFKVFKLDTSNIKKWNPDPKANKEKIQKTIEDAITNILPGRTEEDLLYEIMLKFGIDLTYRIETMEVDGKKVYQIGNGMLYICLDEDISADIAQHIVNDVADKEPESTRVVFKDNGFKGANADAMKTNVVHILKTAGIQEIMSV